MSENRDFSQALQERYGVSAERAALYILQNDLAERDWKGMPQELFDYRVEEAAPAFA